ncbi:MAG: 3-phosphoshikimate 1-carboxyvinyltransferase [bacterium]|nr:3-phosphoshikimate 1-carboxyvinyltransferase [Candidatus Kapabacteria bacterium]
MIIRRDNDSISSRDLVVDCGNSGTTTRLAMGLHCAEPGRFVLVGDRSLSRRPMERVASPLRRLGAHIETTAGALPVRIEGRELDGGESHGVITVESAQVHTAVVIAALRSRAGASIYAARPMRDHTLRMLPLFGVTVNESESGVIRVLPAEVNRDVVIKVPGDFSSAAFMIAAAILVDGSRVTIENVGLNPTRIAFVRALKRMGADVSINASDDREPHGSIHANYSPDLIACTFGGDDDSDVSVTGMIDELPLLALIATQAAGTTRIRDADELRVKESDRIRSTANVLRALGATVIEHPDGLEIDGPQTLTGGTAIDPSGDHRLAMMAAVGAMIARSGAVIENAHVADISYPSYWDDLAAIGATVKRI